MMLLDVSSLASINRFATAWGPRKLHVLVCNAGIMMGPQRQSVDGFDLQLAREIAAMRNRLKRDAASTLPLPVDEIELWRAHLTDIWCGPLTLS